MMTTTSGSATTKTKPNSGKVTTRRKKSALTTPEPICEIQVKAHEQPHMSLGSFTADHPPKGFSIHISPDPEPEAIVTQVTKLGSEWRYELVLHIANYGNRTVSAEVWPL